MLLSVKQYAVLFALFIVFLASGLAYKISLNLEDAREKIHASQTTASKVELEHAIALTLEKIDQSSRELSQWQEVKQQIDNPEIFAYWYNVRFKKTASDSQKYTLDLMIYDLNGRALDRLDDNSLPFEMVPDKDGKVFFRIVDNKDIIYTSPVYEGETGSTIMGYISTRLEFLPLLKSFSQFQSIELDSLALNVEGKTGTENTLEAEDFSYKLHKAAGILVLEKQMRNSIIEIVLIIVVPTVFLYAALVFIVGIPIKGIDKYINELRISPDSAQKESYNSFLQVAELKTVYDSLERYHTDLSQKEEHLALTLNSIGDAVITTNADNNIVRMNPVAENLTGWAFSQAEGMPLKRIFNIMDAASRRLVDRPFEEVISRGEVVHLNKGTILISKDKTEYVIADSAAPIRDASGDIIGLVLVFNDITEQQMKDEQLQHSLKMDALGKLTGGIAHDFNNLLGVILGYSEILVSMSDANSSKTKNYAEQIHSAGERARKLTSQLLAFSRKQTPEAAVADVNQLIKSEQHMLEKMLTARVELSLQLQAGLWPVFLDESLLQDAILNISINSMHAMPEGGSLAISTSNVKIDSTNKYRLDLREGDYIRILISDTGIGMDQSTRRKIFDPFFTTKGTDGTGLGMSQVYGFVQQSGGTINVDSEVGVGTQISIYLPRYLDKEGQSTVDTGEAPIEVASRGSETILVVDDEAALLELSCEILNSKGYHVLGADSGAEALAVLEKQPVDLLISDVIMPKMDGYQLASIVRERFPELKIQMISGFSDDRSAVNTDEALRRKQLQKPFTSDEMLRKVRELLDE